MDINKFVNPNQDRSLFHTSGYAEVAHGNSIGATSAQSFQQRRHLERNRRSVRRYGDSMLAGGHMRSSARHELTKNPRTSPGRTSSLNVTPRTQFREPGGRGYNPYA